MTRFNNLEMDLPPERPDDADPRLHGQDHDEHYWLNLADENRRQGYYDNALRFYSRALEMDKALVHGWLGQTQMLIALEENPEAEVWARKALELFRNHAELLAARAQALARVGDHSEALALCDAALKQEGQSAYRWMVRGEIFIKGRQDIDRHCFEKALSIDKDWLVPLEIGAIYMRYGLPSKATVYFRKAVELAPEKFLVWYRKGCCEIELGLEGAARTSLAQCLLLCPNHIEAAKILGKLEAQAWSPWRALHQLFRWARGNLARDHSL